MPTATLAQLRTRARRKADMVGSNYISTEELDAYINESAAEYYDLLVQSNVDYFNATTTFTISSGNTYSLPSLFYKLRGIDILQGGIYIPILNYNYLERNLLQNISNLRYCSNVQYHISGSVIEFLPEDNAVGSYRIRYIPTFVPLASASDTLDGRNGYDQYVVCDAAIKCKSKEESDTRDLLREKAELKERILAMANTIDYGCSDTVADVRNRGCHGA